MNKKKYPNSHLIMLYNYKMFFDIMKVDFLKMIDFDKPDVFHKTDIEFTEKRESKSSSSNLIYNSGKSCTRKRKHPVDIIYINEQFMFIIGEKTKGILFT